MGIPDYVGSFDASDGWVKITDDDISRAVRFDGHAPEYLSWPDRLWADIAIGRPCLDLGKNAYHVLYLADAMRRAGKWIGPPLVLWDESHPGGRARIADGNHRYRAVQYLRDRHGLDIHVPVNPRRYSEAGSR
jgi:hypothetical protein